MDREFSNITMDSEFSDIDRRHRELDPLASRLGGPPLSAKMMQFLRSVRVSVSDVDLEPSQELESLARRIDATRRDR